MTPELIGAIFTGLTGLVAALAAYTANRSKRVASDQRAMRQRMRLLEAQVLAMVQHAFALELEIARRGGSIPPRPKILEQMDDDEPPAAPQAAPAAPGRHRRG